MTGKTNTKTGFHEHPKELRRVQEVMCDNQMRNIKAKNVHCKH